MKRISLTLIIITLTLFSILGNGCTHEKVTGEYLYHWYSGEDTIFYLVKTLNNNTKEITLGVDENFEQKIKTHTEPHKIINENEFLVRDILFKKLNAPNEYYITNSHYLDADLTVKYDSVVTNYSVRDKTIDSCYVYTCTVEDPQAESKLKEFSIYVDFDRKIVVKARDKKKAKDMYLLIEIKE
ncbi:hypothetical protein [Sediminitomix flava]|uniref:Uncharacterized protein n=1 Tax=Sediminitomix flava TaxID=379075 RepID=A0A315ZFA8_SEDFL|nr:hypothetical protein [Sediminitomix flava]PWJ44245.1 hypothetical protein BC781_101595 [Sediminitomix flava]